MGIRPTGFSTPLFGIDWEYTDGKLFGSHKKKKMQVYDDNVIMESDDEINHIDAPHPERKINVFISSICGVEKYDNMRASLKISLEATGIIKVYMFEAAGASTLSAQDHYLLNLEESDICIFLIDNADGITSGVQREIDMVKQNKIMALYYFCDETSSEKTQLELGMIGARFAKSKVVHHFKELGTDSAKAMISDITDIYHYYCAHKIARVDDTDNVRQIHDISAGRQYYSVPDMYSETENTTEDGTLYYDDKINMDDINNSDINIYTTSETHIIPKSLLEDVSISADYIVYFTTGISHNRAECQSESNEAQSSSESENKQNAAQSSDYRALKNGLDEYISDFMKVLFENKSFEEFDLHGLLGILETYHDSQYSEVVSTRWSAIEAYFNGDIESCISGLESALMLARKGNQPVWVINDILIDIRNQHTVLDEINNRYTENDAQRELVKSEEPVHYPVLDRIKEDLKQEYIDDMYKDDIQSPYAVTFGSGRLYMIGEELAGILAVAMYNGSLTHILSMYSSIKNLLFYLNSRFDDRCIKRDLLKMALFSGKHKEISELENKYSEVISSLSADEAGDIIKFSRNNRMPYRKMISMLEAFHAVGFNLSDETFERYNTLVINDITGWILDDNRTYNAGAEIFKCLSDVAYRMPQDKLGDICCLVMDKKIVTLYPDMFKFIGRYIKLEKLERQQAEKLINHISDVVSDKKQVAWFRGNEICLSDIRKQDFELTEGLDRCIAENMPEYYNTNYKLEITDAPDELEVFVVKYIEKVDEDNINQGKNGLYRFSMTRNIAVIRNILCISGIGLTKEVMDNLIKVLSDTLIESKEDINTKLDAVSLLICIAVRYRDDYIRNIAIYENIIDKKEDIYNECHVGIMSNLDKVSVKIGLCLLGIAIGNNGYQEFLTTMPYIREDTATKIKVTQLITEYLELDEKVRFPADIELIVLQNTLQWLTEKRYEIRWNAVRILIMLLRNPANTDIVNNELISLIDTESVQIKNLIQRQIRKATGIRKETLEYITKKCKNDSSYIVREVCRMVSG